MRSNNKFYLVQLWSSDLIEGYMHNRVYTKKDAIKCFKIYSSSYKNTIVIILECKEVTNKMCKLLYEK